MDSVSAGTLACGCLKGPPPSSNPTRRIRSRRPPPSEWRPTSIPTNTYKLSPQSLVWNIQKLRLLGEIDHYCRVFWWKQSVASNPSYTQCTVTFSGNWNDQDVVWLHVGGSAIGKTVFGAQDNSNTIESAMQPRGPWLAKTGTGEQP